MLSEVGAVTVLSSNEVPQVTVGVPEVAVSAIHRVCHSVGVPDRLVVIEVIFQDCAVIE